MGLINTFVTRGFLMVPDSIFRAIKHPTPKKKDENYTLVLITSDRIVRLSILKAHFIDLINIFVTR